jgi:hypothetical protein
MADSAIAITAGSGTNVETRTVDGDHRQVIVIGDETTNSAIAPVTLANGLLVDVSRVQGNVTVIDGGGTLSIDDGAGSVTIDAPVGTPAFVRLSDGSAAITTLPVSIASVPSHAVTNAGTFATQVDGAALTALQLIDNLVLAEDAVHGSGDPGVQLLAVRQNSQVDFGADGDYVPLSVDDNGGVRVSIVAGAGTGGTAIVDDATFTAAVTSFTPVGGIVTADSVDSGDGGAFAMLANRQQKVTLYNSAGAELSVGGGTQYVEDVAHASGDTGTMALAVRRDANTSLVGTDGDYAPLQVNDIGGLKTTLVGTNSISVGNEVDVNVLNNSAVDYVAVRITDGSAFPTVGVDYTHDTALGTITAVAGPMSLGRASTATPTAVSADDDGVALWATRNGALVTVPAASVVGGATPGKLVSAASTNATNIKNAAGKLLMLTASNVNAAARYLKVYNTSGAPTVGTDVPVGTFIIPGNTAGAGTNIPIPATGINLSTGISIALTTEATDAGTTGVAANEIVVNYAYI